MYTYTYNFISFLPNARLTAFGGNKHDCAFAIILEQRHILGGSSQLSHCVCNLSYIYKAIIQNVAKSV
ncbi:hypothetical protein PUN28_006735 [Cardiocondyla obscurior]|uniref:Uncharacterized protein n=1 Tax=Cardiocondyla obscurior TaxID=286306 RepID=A0AAW2FZM6_9HYME